MRLPDLVATLSLAISRIAFVVGDGSRSDAPMSLLEGNLGLASVVIGAGWAYKGDFLLVGERLRDRRRADIFSSSPSRPRSLSIFCVYARVWFSGYAPGGCDDETAVQPAACVDEVCDVRMQPRKVCERLSLDCHSNRPSLLCVVRTVDM